MLTGYDGAETAPYQYYHGQNEVKSLGWPHHGQCSATPDPLMHALLLFLGRPDTQCIGAQMIMRRPAGQTPRW